VPSIQTTYQAGAPFILFHFTHVNTNFAREVGSRSGQQERGVTSAPATTIYGITIGAAAHELGRLCFGAGAQPGAPIACPGLGGPDQNVDRHTGSKVELL